MQNTFNDIVSQLQIIYNTVLNDKMFMMTTFVIILILIILVIFLYYKIVVPNISNSYVTNKEFTSNTNNSNSEISIILFKTEWCPHCKAAMPEWNKFTRYIAKINDDLDFKIKTTIVDCDKQSSIAEKYNIEGYPSIIAIYKNKVYEYDAKPDKNNLITFIETTINKKLS